jgi:hypothetical protein
VDIKPYTIAIAGLCGGSNSEFPSIVTSRLKAQAQTQIKSDAEDVQAK